MNHWFLSQKWDSTETMYLLCNKTYLLMLSDSGVMQVERKWHLLLTISLLLITLGQCMDSKEVKQRERRTLLDLILQVISDSQQWDKRRCNRGLIAAAQEMKFSSREKPFYVPRMDNSRLIGKLIRLFLGPDDESIILNLPCETAVICLVPAEHSF